MRRITLRISIALMTFFIGFGANSLFRPGRLVPVDLPRVDVEPPVAPEVQVPETWGKIDFADCSFSAPPYLKGPHTHGSEEAVWISRNAHNMILSLDFGAHVSDFVMNSDRPGYREEWFTLNGRPIKVVTFRHDVPAVIWEQSLRYIIAAYFPDTNGSRTKFSVFIAGENRDDQEIAWRILFSIR